jgi:hypothetical protein
MKRMLSASTATWLAHYFFVHCSHNTKEVIYNSSKMIFCTFGNTKSASN